MASRIRRAPATNRISGSAVMGPERAISRSSRQPAEAKAPPPWNSSQTSQASAGGASSIDSTNNPETASIEIILRTRP